MTIETIRTERYGEIPIKIFTKITEVEIKLTKMKLEFKKLNIPLKVGITLKNLDGFPANERYYYKKVCAGSVEAEQVSIEDMEYMQINNLDDIESISKEEDKIIKELIEIHFDN